MRSKSQDILIVDDDEDISELIRYACKQMGLSSHVSADAKQARQWLKSNVPLLIILDIMMPDCNGLDFLRWIRGQEKFSRLPVFVTSGLKDEETARDALELGATDFLRKPYAMNILKEKISSLKLS